MSRKIIDTPIKINKIPNSNTFQFGYKIRKKITAICIQKLYNMLLNGT